jgi:hypothetical protein
MNATDTRKGRRALNELVRSPLMVPLAMIVGDKLDDSAPQVAFVDGKEAVEAFLLDRRHRNLDLASQTTRSGCDGNSTVGAAPSECR